MREREGVKERESFDLNALTTAQDYLRSNKHCHKSVHIEDSPSDSNHHRARSCNKSG